MKIKFLEALESRRALIKVEQYAVASHNDKRERLKMNCTQLQLPGG